MKKLPVPFGKMLQGMLPVVMLAGCSTLGVKVDRLSENAQRREAARILAAAQLENQAADELEQMLAAAREALPGALKGGEKARDTYLAAVAQVVARMQERNFAPGKSVELAPLQKGMLDPRATEAIIPAARVRVRGLHERVTEGGIGTPYVFAYARDSAFLEGQPGISQAGMTLPATAVLTFEGKRARLAFYNMLQRRNAVINRTRAALAADYSAPLAVLVSRGANRSLDLRAFLLTRHKLERAGLFQYQPYDPEKIPVVFVHGLFSRPEAWVQALNGMMADPEIRNRYQFWFFLYPTGLPVWKTASLLRSEMDRYQSTLEAGKRQPNLRRIILVGHSMGGLVSSLVIRQGGDAFWQRFSDVRMEDIEISSSAHEMVREAVAFAPRKDIARVIFIATPHRGSRLASNPVASFFARLVRLPELVKASDRATIARVMREDVRHLFATPLHSMRFLQANSPLITAIHDMPLAQDIPLHSIIGDRGRGDTPRSSDGVVPYWSSHLAQAQTEKIVPSGHGANEHPEGIEEIRRILREGAP